MGAWIETVAALLLAALLHVAPFMGAWIETKVGFATTAGSGTLLPLWEHGLKQLYSFSSVQIFRCSLYGSMD